METGGITISRTGAYDENGVEKLLYDGKTHTDFTQGNITKMWHAYNALCLFLGKPEKTTEDRFKSRAFCLTN